MELLGKIDAVVDMLIIGKNDAGIIMRNVFVNRQG